jgi:hypothetical protein
LNVKVGGVDFEYRVASLPGQGDDGVDEFGIVHTSIPFG